MGKKKFIDKKKSATFQLLARDSSDPNYQDSPGHDRVFIRVDNNPYSVDGIFHESDDLSGPSHYADDPDSIFADAPDDDNDGEEDDRVFGKQSSSQLSIGATAAAAAVPLPDHVRREILELGFPDDGYNYLTHLREIKNTGGGSAFYHNSKARLDQLPLDVKGYDASRVHIGDVKRDPDEKALYSVAEKTVGVRLQKAVDPEVAALLDSNDSVFGSDVEDLEEDFVIQANIHEEGKDDFIGKKLTKEDVDESYTQEPQEDPVEFVGHDEIRNQFVGAGDDIIISEEPRVHRLLDEQFDQLERMEYGTESDDDYGGSVAEDYESLADKLNHALKDHATDDLELNEKYRYENEDPNEDVVVLEESSDESGGWDCETIVSTYSNLDNHPGKIEAPEITRKKKLVETVSGPLSATNHVIPLRGKEKLPVDFLPRGKKPSTEKAKDVSSLRAEQQKRKKHGQEEKKEKKERKTAVKEERREARRVKKETKEMYKSETQRAQRVAAISGPSSIHLS
ncbi:Protein LTV1-like [Vitis vinifera]|uniref:Protein LTV1-like n=1 Tax=Vitis vinifera TaxID=29760 RepID=A0A438ERR1_VITVI|nr:Protein LTV1-like [Vitis vinifera]